MKEEGRRGEEWCDTGGASPLLLALKMESVDYEPRTVGRATGSWKWGGNIFFSKVSGRKAGLLTS